MEPRWVERKISKEKQQAYAQPQHLGNALTMKGLVEFKDQYITASTPAEGSQAPTLTSAKKDSATSLPAEAQQSAVSISTGKDTATPTLAGESSATSVSKFSSDGSATSSSKPEKSSTLEKNKKKLIIFHPTFYLTCPNKPKIQRLDREAVKEDCDIAMECLVDNNHDQTAEAFQEYKSHAADQDHLLSFDFFPGVGDFINAALKVDKEQIPQAI